MYFQHHPFYKHILTQKFDAKVTKYFGIALPSYAIIQNSAYSHSKLSKTVVSYNIHFEEANDDQRFQQVLRFRLKMCLKWIPCIGCWQFFISVLACLSVYLKILKQLTWKKRWENFERKDSKSKKIMRLKVVWKS